MGNSTLNSPTGLALSILTMISLLKLINQWLQQESLQDCPCWLSLATFSGSVNVPDDAGLLVVRESSEAGENQVKKKMYKYFLLKCTLI